MKKIAVAQIVTRLDWGGSPDIIRTICTSLDPALYEVTLITGRTTHPSKKTREFFETFKEKIIVIPELIRDINPLYDLVAFAKLFLLFSRKKFDIVHSHTAKAGALARCAAYCAKRPVIVHTPHGHNFYGYFPPAASRLLILAERFLAYFTDKIIALTDLEKKDFLKYRVGNSEKIRVIYQGLALESDPPSKSNAAAIKKQFGIKEDERVIGMIGRLEPVKDPCTFVKAAEIIASTLPKTKFILMGEGSLRRKIESMILELGLEEKFILTGWLDNSREVLSVFDVMALSSLNEAVGIVLIEAQSKGVPVVATRVGGIPEVVQDGLTGILVPPANPAALAAALNILLTNNSARETMGKAARSWVGSRFDEKNMVGAISMLYGELLTKAAT